MRAHAYTSVAASAHCVGWKQREMTSRWVPSAVVFRMSADAISLFQLHGHAYTQRGLLLVVTRQPKIYACMYAHATVIVRRQLHVDKQYTAPQAREPTICRW
jgi:hypothetical protein